MSKGFDIQKERHDIRKDVLDRFHETNGELLARLASRMNKPDMNDLSLASLSHIMNTDFAKEEAKWLRVDIQIPGMPLPESIFNPRENFEQKLIYYITFYNEDLTLKSNPDIRIIGYELTSESPFE